MLQACLLSHPEKSIFQKAPAALVAEHSFLPEPIYKP